MYSRKHVQDLAVGFGIVLAIVGGFTWTMSAYAEEAKGMAPTKEQAIENSMIAAHFTCNRQGLWADPDTLELLDFRTDKYRLPGGRAKLPYITVSVSFDCTTEFKKEAAE